MAKIMVEMDTEAHTMEVKVDGTKVDNVKSVGLMCDEEYDYCGVEICMYEMMGDLRKVTKLLAKDSDEGKEAVANGEAKDSSFNDLLLVYEKNDVASDIMRFMRSK